MKKTTWIARTAVCLALLIAVQFFTKSLGQLVTGSCVNLVLAIKQGFTSFDFPFALTGGGPVRATEVVGILIYNDAYKNMRFATANAESCILFLFVALFSFIQLWLTHRKEEGA